MWSEELDGLVAAVEQIGVGNEWIEWGAKTGHYSGCSLADMARCRTGRGTEEHQFGVAGLACGDGSAVDDAARRQLQDGLADRRGLCRWIRWIEVNLGVAHSCGRAWGKGGEARLEGAGL